MDSAYNSELDELSMEEEEHIRGSTGKRNRDNKDDSKYKSKNLKAERKRRAKLNDRLLQLRTSMTKANIIKDAITYIEELDKEVEVLKNELLELETYEHHEENSKPIKEEKPVADQEMNNWSREPEIKVLQIDDKKVWMKVVYQKRLGGFTKLVEAITDLGYEFNDTNLITSQGAVVVTSCLEGLSTLSLDVEETKEVLQSAIGCIWA